MQRTPHDPDEFDEALAPSYLAVELDRPQVSRAGRLLRMLSSFVFGQGAAQGLNVLASIYLVRTLSVEAYAQFGLATGFQNIFSVLMDLGFASTIVPLVGDRGGDPAVLGRYVRSAQHLRNRSFWILAPVASIAFLGIMHRHGWSWTVQLGLLAAVLLSLYSQGQMAYFSAPLFILGRLREYYIPQVVTATGRILAYLALTFTGGLNSWTAAGLTALNLAMNGNLIQRASRTCLVWPAKDDPATDRELIRYILPASPAIIFSAFQAQIAVLLLGLFGGTLYLAQVTALSRIGQLFAVLMTFNGIVIEPYIARVSRLKLGRVYALVVLLACLGCAPLALVAFRWPGVYLVLLGRHYEGLGDVMGWYVLSACINFVAGVVWIMNRARKWVFWSGSILEVLLVLGIQIGFLVIAGLHTTADAVRFSLITTIGPLVAHAYVAVRGFTQGAPAEQTATP